MCVNISCCCCCFTCFPYSRCHSATQSLSSSTTASICRSSSTHVLSYARHSSIISIHESESSKRIIRLRFVSLSLSFPPTLHSHTYTLMHSVLPPTLTVTVFVVVALTKTQLPASMVKLYFTTPTLCTHRNNSSNLCMICVFHCLFHPRSLSTCQPKINQANAAGQVTCGRVTRLSLVNHVKHVRMTPKISLSCHLSASTALPARLKMPLRLVQTLSWVKLLKASPPLSLSHSNELSLMEERCTVAAQKNMT